MRTELGTIYLTVVYALCDACGTRLRCTEGAHTVPGDPTGGNGLITHACDTCGTTTALPFRSGFTSDGAARVQRAAKGE